MQDHALREIVWLGDVRERLCEMPVAVRRSFGYTLYALQCNSPRTADIEPLQGHRATFEIRKNHVDTYRLFYWLGAAGRIVVLHACKKKSHEGSKLPREIAVLIEQRLKSAKKSL